MMPKRHVHNGCKGFVPMIGSGMTSEIIVANGFCHGLRSTDTFPFFSVICSRFLYLVSNTIIMLPILCSPSLFDYSTLRSYH